MLREDGYEVPVNVPEAATLEVRPDVTCMSVADGAIDDFRYSWRWTTYLPVNKDGSRIFVASAEVQHFDGGVARSTTISFDQVLGEPVSERLRRQIRDLTERHYDRPEAVLLGHHTYCSLRVEAGPTMLSDARCERFMDLAIYLDEADPNRCTVLVPPMRTMIGGDYNGPGAGGGVV